MTDQRAEEFNEELLSGFLDGALVQQDEQRVRVHIEGSAEARKLLVELRQMREAARDTKFVRPPDLQFSERPKSGVSRVSRFFGAQVVGVWSVALVGYISWEVVVEEGPWIPKALLFGLFSGLVLLLLSVLLDRLRDAKDDRYRGVEK
jgi:hypothetical protein